MSFEDNKFSADVAGPSSCNEGKRNSIFDNIEPADNSVQNTADNTINIPQTGLHNTVQMSASAASISAYHSHLIPPLTTDIGAWAIKVRKLLILRNINLTDTAMSQAYMPLILKSLPSYIITYIPDNINLDSLLALLMRYNRTTGGDLADKLRREGTLPDIPSVVFMRLVEEAQRKTPTITRDGARLNAWASMKVALPLYMRSQIAMAGIREFPDDLMLHSLDGSWEEHLISNATPRTSPPSTNPPIAVSAVNSTQAQEKSMYEMESQMKLLINAVSDLKNTAIIASNTRMENHNGENGAQSQNGNRGSSNGYSNSYNNYSRPPYRPYQNSATNTFRGGNYGANNTQNSFKNRRQLFEERPDKRVCYYHFFYPKNAQKCNLDECPHKNTNSSQYPR
jgi:hypothetical protein